MRQYYRVWCGLLLPVTVMLGEGKGWGLTAIDGSSQPAVTTSATNSLSISMASPHPPNSVSEPRVWILDLTKEPPPLESHYQCQDFRSPKPHEKIRIQAPGKLLEVEFQSDRVLCVNKIFEQLQGEWNYLKQLASPLPSNPPPADQKDNQEAVQPTLKQAVLTIIKATYLAKGYLNTLVEDTSAQNEEKITINVTPGQLVTPIDVQGSHRLQDYVRDRVNLAVPTSSIALNANNIENQLRLLREDPAIENIDAVLKDCNQPIAILVFMQYTLRAQSFAPSVYTAPYWIKNLYKAQESCLTVTVKEAKRWSLSAFVDNNSPPSVGSVRSGVDLSYRHLLVPGDVGGTSFYRSTTGGNESLEFRYGVPLNAMDGVLQLRVAPRNRNRVTQREFEPFGIRGQSELYEVSFRQPWQRTPQDQWAVSLGLTRQTGQVFISDQAVNDLDTRTTVLRLGVDGLHRSTQHAFFWQVQANVGTGWFGVSQPTATSPGGQFLSLVGQLQWLQRLNLDQAVLLQLEGQYAFDGLPPSQQFVLGGSQFLRGYRQNSRIGDSGVRFSAEWRVNLWNANKEQDAQANAKCPEPLTAEDSDGRPLLLDLPDISCASFDRPPDIHRLLIPAYIYLGNLDFRDPDFRFQPTPQTPRFIQSDHDWHPIFHDDFSDLSFNVLPEPFVLRDMAFGSLENLLYPQSTDLTGLQRLSRFEALQRVTDCRPDDATDIIPEYQGDNKKFMYRVYILRAGALRKALRNIGSSPQDFQPILGFNFSRTGYSTCFHADGNNDKKSLDDQINPFQLAELNKSAEPFRQLLEKEIRRMERRQGAGGITLTVAPFFDAGVVWNNANNPAPFPDDQFLASMGIGFELEKLRRVGDRQPALSMKLTYGIPLVKVTTRGSDLQDAGLYFSIRYRF